MYTYNVTIKIEKSIRQDWILWMQTIHIPEVMATKLFISNKFSELLEPIDEEGDTFVIQYFCESIAQYNNYIAIHAPTLRQKGFDAFGNKFIAFRSLLKEV